MIAADLLGRHGADDRGRAQYALAQRMAVKDDLSEVIGDQLAGRILVHGDLLDHDFALQVDIGEDRMQRPCRT